MERRGQAAMEFLMTYGWAILAAVIAIAVLAYFGVFSPSKYVPNACTLAAPLGCNTDATSVAVTEDGITLTVSNTGSDTITITGIDITNCGSATGLSDELVVGQEAAVTTVGCTLGEGDKFRGTITVTYTKGTVEGLQSTGSLTATVRAGA